jgi:hypothetical protein
MSWLLLGALGIVWAAFLFPPRLRRTSEQSSVEEFERTMGLLAETERATGRWIVAPRKSERFVGPGRRARSRARARRRLVFFALMEAIGLTFLIGIFPPLHAMWIATGVLGAGFVLYVGYLLLVKRQERATPATRVWPGQPGSPPARNGHEKYPLDEPDLVHVTVRPARELEAARV